MSTDTSPLAGPNTLAILNGAVDAIRASPAILGLFLLSGILRAILVQGIDSVLRLVFIIIGVVFAYRALGGRIRTDTSGVLRLFIALLATLASYLLIVVGILSIIIPGVFGWITFLTLVPLGIYVYLRLFLSTPAVMIDGYGPAEALAVSWRLMKGSVLATTFALLLVVIGGMVTLGPILWVTRSGLLLNIGGILIMDTLLAGTQAFLYVQLAETPEPTVPDEQATESQDVSGWLSLR
jgi:hypothetical protein